jgi:sporadic carbohydrate cluster 2OG-Fe(II) oxygenase
MGNSFFEAEESQFIEQFLQQGYIIFPLEDLEGLRTIKTNLYQWAMEYLGLKNSLPEKDLGDQIHQWVTLEEVNDFRVHLINRLKKDMNLRPKIYHLAKKYIHWIVGNELAMQRSCNLSIQMPQDDSSLLPLHSDVWSGNSPYEIVFWFPFVDCYKTKSMFILPKKRNGPDS